ncbi:MAG: 50S ribosomal protein L25/general stress protein Ctc [Rhodospirillaceae bacterium]|jgi:large subunit ribosomal protein L25|nr:50S ribosomal protein L25/general stress protein Ctc [Rhodospirillaceae bacterium]MBT5241149.1 50S ribosomal protein L25/general stress protein Ctc [Rhodospirillaceae bacterium]MBT5565661.1 50S ribosomal protein L25/general stress protein Ctc [Rhodospirillaceae bacterium]MBT6090867.1 50S ribosomal protein L25/general stress protein Ctc [Rhodospirillaceae bacterium]MBT6960142.1 50S ribosomal protein L25/general stress protein Ctc [Rhodospirillaceae bacterium]
MANVSALTVQGRDRAGKGAARATRREGLVPGVIYGDSKEPVLISMKPRDLFVEMHKPGFATQIFEITVGKDTQRAMAQDVQMHPVRDVPVHVDFRRIGKNTVVTVEVPVHFSNEEESPGIKQGGVVNVVRHQIEVRARPDALPERFEIDLTGLEIGDSVHISAITMPEGVAPTITDRDFTICTLAAPTVQTAAEDEEDAEAAEGEAAEGEDAEGEDAKKEESGD